MPNRTIIARRVPLAEIIGLNVRGVASDEFPVHLIQIVGLEDDAADDSPACGGSHPYFDFAEEEVEFGLDGGGFALGVDREFGARGAVFDDARGGVPGAAGGGGDEVVGVVCAEGGVGGAGGCVEGVAGCEGLGGDRRCGEGGEEGEG